MGPDRATHVRNALIVVAIALAVWLLPGGGTGANAVGGLISLVFLGGLAFLGYRLYMERRTTLLDLDDRSRLIVYGAFAVIVFALAAASRMWGAGGVGALLWMALVGIAVYGLYGVYRTQREY